jgi:trafficking protein particle complex subunit 4
MQCFNTQTGIKFLLFTDTLQTGVTEATMRRVYELYADYVMKNPFYQLEMPVRCDMFDRKLNSYIREINNSR